jgi:hypothetical protein
MLSYSKITLPQSVLWALIPVALLGGCSSSRAPYGAAVQVIGTPLDHAQVAVLEKKLLGRPVQVAVDELGAPFDVLRDVNGSRQWFVFRIDRNTLGKYRYVVEVNHDQVAAVSKVEIGGAAETDTPRRYVLREKVMGKRPQQCRRELGLGPPLLTLSSEKTRRSTELYDARLAKGRQIYYCVVRYNPSNYCEDLAFITAGASTKQELHQ